MNSASIELCQYMKSLSRQAYHEQWCDHLEFVLWLSLVQGPMQYGHLTITSSHVDRLSKLSQRCGGWIYYKRHVGPTWVPLVEWQDIFTGRFDPITMG